MYILKVNSRLIIQLLFIESPLPFRPFVRIYTPPLKIILTNNFITFYPEQINLISSAKILLEKSNELKDLMKNKEHYTHSIISRKKQLEKNCRIHRGFWDSYLIL